MRLLIEVFGFFDRTGQKLGRFEISFDVVLLKWLSSGI